MRELKMRVYVEMNVPLTVKSEFDDAREALDKGEPSDALCEEIENAIRDALFRRRDPDDDRIINVQVLDLEGVEDGQPEYDCHIVET